MIFCDFNNSEDIHFIQNSRQQADKKPKITESHPKGATPSRVATTWPAGGTSAVISV